MAAPRPRHVCLRRGLAEEQPARTGGCVGCCQECRNCQSGPDGREAMSTWPAYLAGCGLAVFYFTGVLRILQRANSLRGNADLTPYPLPSWGRGCVAGFWWEVYALRTTSVGDAPDHRQTGCDAE